MRRSCPAGRGAATVHGEARPRRPADAQGRAAGRGPGSARLSGLSRGGRRRRAARSRPLAARCTASLLAFYPPTIPPPGKGKFVRRVCSVVLAVCVVGRLRWALLIGGGCRTKAIGGYGISNRVLGALPNLLRTSALAAMGLEADPSSGRHTRPAAVDYGPGWGSDGGACLTAAPSDPRWVLSHPTSKSPVPDRAAALG